MKAEALLPMTLAVAVPWWIHEIREWPPRARLARAADCARRILEGGNYGAELIYNDARPGETASAFNALALGIACCAFQPGGVRAFGLHWCAAHHPAGVKAERQTCQECAP